MAIETSDTLSPREYILLQAEQEEARLARDHDLNVRRMEIEQKRNEFAYRRGQAKRNAQHERRIKELELAIKQEEAKWQQLVRIPLIIARWPIYLILGLGYCIAMLRKVHPKPDFWEFLSK